MLEHLVCVDDVKARVLEVHGVDIPGPEGDVGDPRGARRLPRQLDDPFGAVEPDDVSGCDPPREVDGDRARPAPDVEQALAGNEGRQKVRG